jgi:hypothetical protein
MTGAELAEFLDDLGARDALLLDGGGAAALYIGAEGGVVSSPSDGVERVVANHLGVRFGALAPGQLVGFVRDSDIFDDTANLEGALVTLDDGSTDVVGADGLYNFPGVAPRLACATASLAGYTPNTRCHQVLSNEVNYNSIPLYPIGGGPDAGAPVDASGLPDGAGPGDADGGPTRDAGNGGGGGGCCAAGGPGAVGDGGGISATLFWATLVAAVLARRRSRPRADRSR